MADASNMSYLYTIGGYATLFGLGYAVYHVSTQKTNKRPAAPAARTVKSSQSEPRKEDRKKKQRLESFTSEARDASRAKAEIQETYAEQATEPSNAAADMSDDGVDNREFARQLAKAKEGKKFTAKSDGGKQKEKSVKQSRANQMGSAAPAKQPSDAATEPADDQSPAGSPESRPVDSTGISDMLEPTPAGPSVLRITDMDKVKEKPKKVAKAPEKVETKKQRQNRKKAESAKEAREDMEKERRVLEEKQRRAARIAEGRAAKDGSQFKAATGGNSSWNQGAPKPAANGASTKVNGDSEALYEPLDTFDKPVPSGKPANASKPAPAKQGNSWTSSLPSEEEQLEMLKDTADEWSTVTTKASKKGNKKSVESGDESAPTKPVAVQAKQNNITQKKASNGPSTQSFGAFSALTNNDDATEDAEEEEWDV